MYSRQVRFQNMNFLLEMMDFLIKMAGFVFTSESGLIQNSWVGKFHMVRFLIDFRLIWAVFDRLSIDFRTDFGYFYAQEMKMWHTAHFALWGRHRLLGHTNLW